MTVARRAGLWLPPALWTAVILVASGDRFSADETGGLLETLLAWLWPDLDPARADGIHFVLRKAAHVFEYGLLAALVQRALAGGTHLARTPALVTAATWVLGVAVCDELHQALASTRSGSLVDVALDGAAGLAVLAVLSRKAA